MLLSPEEYAGAVERHAALRSEYDDPTTGHRRRTRNYRSSAEDIQRLYGLEPVANDAGAAERSAYLLELERRTARVLVQLSRHRAAEELVEASEKPGTQNTGETGPRRR